MEGIGNEHVRSAIGQIARQPRQSHLVRPREKPLVVVNEAVVVMPCDIGRIREHQVTTADIPQRDVEVATSQPDSFVCKDVGAGIHDGFVDKILCSVGARRER